MKKFPILFFVAAGLFVSAFSTFAQDKGAASGGVTELHKKGFNSLVAAIATTDLADKIEKGSYTIIAPTDVAFRDLPKTQIDALLADKVKLTALLSNHIVEGKVTTADLKSGTFKTLGGATLKAKVVDGKLKIGAATVVRSDIPTASGYIHGVDKFLEQ